MFSTVADAVIIIIIIIINIIIIYSFIETVKQKRLVTTVK